MTESITLKERKSPLLIPEIANLKLKGWLNAEDLPTYLEIFSGTKELEKLRDKKNQIIFGRRGTGKSHFLRAFNQQINEEIGNNQISIYFSCIDVIETPPDIEKFSDELRDRNYADYYFRKLLLKFADLFTDVITNYISNKRSLSKEVLKQVDSIIDKRILNEIYRGSEEIIIKTNISGSTLKKRSSRGFVLQRIGTFLPFLQLGKEKDLRNGTHENEIRYYTTDLTKLKDAIVELLELLQIDTLYICIDEWAELDKSVNSTIQIHFAQKIKKFLFKNPRISIKIASIWHETELSYKTLNASRSGGLEIGQDIYKSIDLDTLFLENEKTIVDFLSNLIFKRINFFLNNKLEYLKKNQDYLATLIDEIFGTAKNFKELVSASHGVPRDFLELFARCLNLAENRLDKYIIDRNLVEEVAINYFKNEKRALISGNESYIQFSSLIDNYIKEKNVRFFAVKTSIYKYSIEIKELVDKKLLQQIPSANIPREIRDNFKVFLIDYGNYCEYLKAHKAQTSDYSFSPLIEFTDEIISNFRNYILNLDLLSTDYIFCKKCNDYVHKTQPVYQKFKVCPYCASTIE
jgi:hypothetical protein